MSLLCTVTTNLQAKNAKGYSGVQKHTEHDPNIKHSNHDINFSETRFNVYNESAKARKTVTEWNNDKFSDFVNNHDKHQRSMGHPERCYGSVQGYLKNRRKATGVLTIGNMAVQTHLIKRFCPASSYDEVELADGTKHAKFKLYDSNNNPIEDNIKIAKQFYSCFNKALINATANNVGWNLKDGTRVNIGDYLHRGRYATNNDEMGMSHIHFEVATYGLTKGGKKRKSHATSSLNQAIVSLHHAVTNKYCSGRDAIKWYRAQIDKYALICLERELHKTYQVPKKEKILIFERKTSEDPSTMTGLSMNQLKQQKQELAQHQQRVQQLQQQANDLDNKNKSAQKRIEQVQQLNDVAKSVMNDVQDTYQTLTGQKLDNATSPLDVAKAIKSASDDVKSEVNDNRDTIKRQKQRISQQQQQLDAQQRQLQDIKKQQEALKKENYDLKAENSGLRATITQLRKQIQSAGLIVSEWIKSHWNKLEQHFNTYARDMNSATNERIYGGPDGNGDTFMAHQFEQRAKNGLIGAFENIERNEFDKSGFGQVLSDSSKQSQNDDELQA